MKDSLVKVVDVLICKTLKKLFLAIKGEKLWEADIKYTTEQLEWMKGNTENRQRRGLARNIRLRWPNNVANYVLSLDYSEYLDFISTV